MQRHYFGVSVSRIATAAGPRGLGVGRLRLVQRPQSRSPSAPAEAGVIQNPRDRRSGATPARSVQILIRQTARCRVTTSRFDQQMTDASGLRTSWRPGRQLAERQPFGSSTPFLLDTLGINLLDPLDQVVRPVTWRPPAGSHRRSAFVPAVVAPCTRTELRMVRQPRASPYPRQSATEPAPPTRPVPRSFAQGSPVVLI